MPVNKMVKLYHTTADISNLSPEILVVMFAYLDHKSLLNCARVSKRWRRLYQQFKGTLWQTMLKREFNTASSKETAQITYKTQLNFHDLEYKFLLMHEDAIYNEDVIETYIEASNDLDVLFVWPNDPHNCYLVAFDGRQICWIDQQAGPTTNIYVSSIKSTQETTISPERVLSDHDLPLMLLLTDGNGTLAAFDENSTVYFWNLVTFERVGRLETQSALNQLLSMNLTKSKLVLGGSNGKIAVWDVETLRLSYIFDTGDKPLNVGLYENTIVYGLRNGQYKIHDMNRKKTIQTVDVTQQENLQDLTANPALPAETQGDNTLLLQTDHELFGVDASIPPDIRFVPRTLALNGHILLTIGHSTKSIILWDIRTGKKLTTLSQSIAVEPPFTDDDIGFIHVAELSNDSTLIFGCAEHDFDSRLVLWDFYAGKRRNCCFKADLYAVESFDFEPLTVWICAKL